MSGAYYFGVTCLKLPPNFAYLLPLRKQQTRVQMSRLNKSRLSSVYLGVDIRESGDNIIPKLL
jgi:hypothetical protein